jgi:hypothetical protein
VLAHAHALLRGTPEGVTRYIYGELREPAAILRASAETPDFTRPTAVLLFGILHFFSEDDDPAGIVRRLMSPLQPGSYVAITHLARDVAGDALTKTFSRLNAEMAESVVLRTRADRCAVRRPGEHRARSRAAAAVAPGLGRPGAGAAADVVRGRPQDRRPVLAVGSWHQSGLACLNGRSRWESRVQHPTTPDLFPWSAAHWKRSA